MSISNIKILMRLKAVFIAIVVCLVIQIGPVHIASAIDTLELPAEFNEQEFREFVAKKINEIHRPKLTKKITSAEIDFDWTFKLYVGTDVFEFTSDAYSEIKQTLEQKTLMYYVPVFLDGEAFVAHVSRVPQPNKENVENAVQRGILTREEAQEREALVGTWTIDGGEQLSELDYKQLYGRGAQVAGPNGDYLLVSGFTTLRYPTALISDNTGKITKLVPLEPKTFSWSMFGLVPQEGDVVLDYQLVKERGLALSQCINANPTTFSEGYVGTGTPVACTNIFGEPVYNSVSETLEVFSLDSIQARGTVVFIVGLIVMAAGATAWLVLLRHRRKQREFADLSEKAGED